MKKGKAVTEAEGDLEDLFNDVEQDAKADAAAAKAEAKKPKAEKAVVQGGPNRIVSLVDVPPGMIEAKPHETNTRAHDADVWDLRESIAAAGVIFPLEVQKLGEGKYRLLDGTRRLKAAVALGLKTVPCVVVTGEVQIVSAISEVRKAHEPMEQARAYQLLVEEYDIDQQQLARLVGKTPAHVSQVLSLLKAPESVKKAVERGIIKPSEVRKAVKVHGTKATPKQIMDQKSQAFAVPEDDMPGDGVAMKLDGNLATVTIKVMLKDRDSAGTEVAHLLKSIAVGWKTKAVNAYCKARGNVGRGGSKS